MKKIAYTVSDSVVLQTFVDPDAKVDFEYIDVTNIELPTEPIETWIIKEKKIEIDQDKLAVFNRSQLHPLTRHQFKRTLLDFNMKDQVESMIKQIADPEIKSRIEIDYFDADRFERTSESVIYMTGMLELTAEQVDQMWLHAMSL